MVSRLCGPHSVTSYRSQNNFGQLILAKIIKIVATRDHDVRFQDRNAPNSFSISAARLRPRPAGRITALPRSLAGGEACCPLPKNPTHFSRPCGPWPRCSHALFFPDLGMSGRHHVMTNRSLITYCVITLGWWHCTACSQLWSSLLNTSCDNPVRQVQLSLTQRALRQHQRQSGKP